MQCFVLCMLLAEAGLGDSVAILLLVLALRKLPMEIPTVLSTLPPNVPLSGDCSMHFGKDFVPSPSAHSTTPTNIKKAG